MFQILAFYKFTPIEIIRASALRESIRAFCEARQIRGLLLLGTEGINATVSGASAAMQEFRDYLEAQPEIGKIAPKISASETQVFERLKVQVRNEIVTLNRPDIFPVSEKNYHLSPEEWHQTLTSDEDFLLLDTRNDYETEIGKFRGTVDPHLTQFSEFPAFVENQQIPKDKKILMYCTGGIRCEKALVYMKQEGYENVYQLDGGILSYLEKYPKGEFEGECFVFDQRIAVDSELKPSTQWSICPLCGDPGKETITCGNCGKAGTLCSKCASDPMLNVCSLNCKYHFARKSAFPSVE